MNINSAAWPWRLQLVPPQRPERPPSCCTWNSEVWRQTGLRGENRSPCNLQVGVAAANLVVLDCSTILIHLVLLLVTTISFPVTVIIWKIVILSKTELNVVCADTEFRYIYLHFLHRSKVIERTHVRYISCHPPGWSWSAWCSSRSGSRSPRSQRNSHQSPHSCHRKSCSRNTSECLKVSSLSFVSLLFLAFLWLFSSLKQK